MKKIKHEVVRRLIAETGLSPRAWAIQHGFPQQTVNAWLHGDRNIGGKSLLRLASALRVEPEEICSVVFRVDRDQLAETRRREEDLIGFFHGLTAEQQDRVLRMVQGLAEANAAESELKHG